MEDEEAELEQSENDGYFEGYDSGPFCRHYSDPLDCEQECARCGHRCTAHGAEDGDFACYEEDCTCSEWQDSDD